jgi:hypothetical protein
MFPKHQAFSICVATQEQAIQIATSKRKYGGCFEQIGNGFMVYWLPKHLSFNFAW